MFQTHEDSGFKDIKLYILLQQTQLSQIIDPSQVFCETSDEEQAKVDVVDNEEEKDEILVDHMVNDESIDHKQQPLPWSHVYYLPEHMTKLNLGEDEPSLYIFYNLYMQTDGALKVGDMFHTK